jgi:hypothetical protein
MEFKKAAIISNYLSKDYAEELFKLLLNYHDISASEAASRLDMHIRTVQDFLEVMADFDILHRERVFERKRPYNRYRLKKKKILVEIDLEQELKASVENEGLRIREKSKSGARFSTARNGAAFSSVTLWVGKGRDQKERRISLTQAQGAFLYHLPFPDGKAKTVEQLMKKAGIDGVHLNEIRHIVDELIALRIIEKI